MHNNSLGITVKIVEAIGPYAESLGQRKEAVAATIDERILQIPRYVFVSNLQSLRRANLYFAHKFLPKRMIHLSCILQHDTLYLCCSLFK